MVAAKSSLVRGYALVSVAFDALAMLES